MVARRGGDCGAGAALVALGRRLWRWGAKAPGRRGGDHGQPGRRLLRWGDACGAAGAAIVALGATAPGRSGGARLWRWGDVFSAGAAPIVAPGRRGAEAVMMMAARRGGMVWFAKMQLHAHLISSLLLLSSYCLSQSHSLATD